MNAVWPGPSAPADVEFGDVLADTSLLAHSVVKAPLSGLRVVRVTGSDAESFIHAQFTADCRGLASGTHLLTAWCSPKGRVLFAPQLIATGDGFHLLLPASQAAAFARRLRMYVLRARVEVSDPGADFGVMLLAGPVAFARPPAFDGIPGAASASSSDGRRHWLSGPQAALAEIWPTLAAEAVGANAARLLAIRAGLFELEEQTSDVFLPQELDLDRSGGVSFEKGCYPGQEIVARVRFRGTVKRRLARLGSRGELVPAAGTRLLAGEDTPAGTVLAAARASAQTLEMLAVLDVDAPATRLAAGGADAVMLAGPREIS